jgi:hypothetical protein
VVIVYELLFANDSYFLFFIFLLFFFLGLACVQTMILSKLLLLFFFFFLHSPNLFAKTIGESHLNWSFYLNDGCMDGMTFAQLSV